jgi:hypothetical protein
VATVDASGLVTAHAVPQTFGETPYIEVSADGVAAGNAAVIRVTDSDLGLSYQMYPAEHVSFYLAPMIEGVDLNALTLDFDVVEATERAYVEQTDGVGTVPLGGAHQYYALDVTDDPVTSVCGASGNPIRLGWLWGQPVHNSCFIVNDPPNRVPQWFVMFHELGHNFTCACYSFNLYCAGPSTPHNIAYLEGLGTLAALWSWRSIMADPHGLGALAVADIERQFQSSASYYRQKLLDYQNAGASYDLIDADIVDGILCEMEDAYGQSAWFDLFSTFLPPEESLPIALDTREKQATWFVAAMSVSAGEDLRGLFRTEYGYPIDDTAWPGILAEVETRIAARGWTPGAISEDSPLAPLAKHTLWCTPNPTRSPAAVSFALDDDGPVTLSIHDVMGRRVITLVAGVLTAGEHSRPWNLRDASGRPVSAGIYFAHLTAATGTATRKLTVLR